MKRYKVRVQCTGFRDVVVTAKNKANARIQAEKIGSGHCDGEYEFCEFLELK